MLRVELTTGPPEIGTADRVDLRCDVATDVVVTPSMFLGGRAHSEVPS